MPVRLSVNSILYVAALMSVFQANYHSPYDMFLASGVFRFLRLRNALKSIDKTLQEREQSGDNAQVLSLGRLKMKSRVSVVR